MVFFKVTEIQLYNSRKYLRRFENFLWLVANCLYYYEPVQLRGFLDRIQVSNAEMDKNEVLGYVYTMCRPPCASVCFSVKFSARLNNPSPEKTNLVCEWN